MNYKDHAKKIVSKLLKAIKPLVTALVLVGLLQVTGLMNSISYLGQVALLESGLKDADDEMVTPGEEFDFNFSVKDLAGNKLPFEQFKGKVIFLNMWATWCGPCRAEMAGIQKLYSKIDSKKIAFVMLSIDSDSDQEKVVSYVQKKKFTFPTYLPSGYLPEQLKVPAIPTTFIITRDGKIARKEIGTTRYDTAKFQKFLEDLSK